MPKREFNWAPADDSIEFKVIEKRLLGGDRQIAVTDWLSASDKELMLGRAEISAWLDDEQAFASNDLVLVNHSAIAALTERKAQSLSLPPDAPYVLSLDHHSTLDRDDFRFIVGWTGLNGIPAMGAERNGVMLEVGTKTYRLPKPLYELIEAVDQFNEKAPEGRDERLYQWSLVQEHLPAEAVANIEADRYIDATRVAHATAFSLSLKAGPDGIDFDPVLFGPQIQSVLEDVSDQDAEPEIPERDQVVPEAYQQVFARERFRVFENSQPHYALGEGWYVAIDPELRQALDIVRDAQSADTDTRREFARTPRAYLRNQLPDDYPEEALEALFIETVEYSQRVQAVGLWQPPVLPWIQQSPEQWLPEKFGLRLGGEFITLDADEVPRVLMTVEEAIEQGKPTIDCKGKEIPANEESLEALRTLLKATRKPPAEDKPESEDEAPEENRDLLVLQIEENLDELGFKRQLTPRKAHAELTLPATLQSRLKSHQHEGLQWLWSAWQSGLPGVLLADDMGLGKTLQALAFLAWLRERMQAGERRRRPVGVVAPVGLLNNWQMEHDLHFDDGGIGEPLIAYGSAIKSLRTGSGRETQLGAPVLDTERIRRADWVLTTYETIRDYQHSFGAVPFEALIFDEVQKIKTPGTLVTEAAKAMNVDFVVSMTGTPIENRLADLWCIMDMTQPGYLGNLAEFSKTYERDMDEEKLVELKSRLADAAEACPPSMLRRLKVDSLEGLPDKIENVLEVEMPPIQANAYREAVLEAKTISTKGGMLKALQALRSVSLHPVHPEQADGEHYIQESARLAACFSVLDKIAKADEKSLIFVESLDMQPVLAALIQQRFGLDRPPLLISGKVSGPARQQRVNEFQQRGAGFDVIILSPRAGGVGLTLTAANHVIHLSRWWNPAVEDQCTDRVYRIGQKRDVQVYYPQAIHPDPDLREASFDLKLHALLARKRDLSREFLVPPVADGDAAGLFGETVRQTT